MIDQIYDRAYQDSRDAMNGSIDRLFGRVGDALRRVPRVRIFGTSNRSPSRRDRAGLA